MVVRRRDHTLVRSAAWERFRRLGSGHADPSLVMRVIVGELLHGITFPPTDLQSVAQKLGVLDFSEEVLPVSGEVRIGDGGSMHVVTATGLSRSRKRFTIAHELGHVLMAGTGPGYPRAGKALERLCDMFAGELLMPHEAFTTACGNAPRAAQLVEAARRFDTSLYATAVRCFQLGKTSSFTVVRDRLDWSCGNVSRLESAFQEILERVAAGQDTADIIHRRRGHTEEAWWINGTPLNQPGRALFVLRRAVA